MSGTRKRIGYAAGAALLVVVSFAVIEWLHDGHGHKVPQAVPRVAQQRNNISSSAISTPVSHAPTIKKIGVSNVCGFGQAPADITDLQDLDRYVFAQTQKTYDRWKVALLNSSDYRARAVGLVIQRAESNPDQSTVQAEESRDELVQLAAGAGDPATYAIAIGLCRTALKNAITTGACQRISFAEWSRLDPDNAIPWLATAQAARRSGDTQAESAAFVQAASAHKIESYDDSFIQSAQSEIPQDATPLDRAALTITLIGYQAAWARPDLRESTDYCSTDALQQGETRKQCNAIAELFINHGTTLIDLSFGRRLGVRVGWSPARLSTLLQEQAALMRFATAEERDPWSCENVARLNERMDKRMQLGELEALRELEGSAASDQLSIDAIHQN